MDHLNVLFDNNLTTGGYANLNRQRKEGFLCDIELVVEGKRFQAHKAVLAANSDYFATMFRTNMKEKYAESVTLKEFSYETVDNILEYIYSGQIKISIHNVTDILQAALLMQLTNLSEIIDKYLLENVNQGNCLWLKKISVFFDLNLLQQKVEKCIHENFGTLCQSDKFMEISDAELQEYFQSDELIVESENILFTTLVSWTNHDFQIRKEKFSNLFSSIRLQLVSVDFLSNTIRKHDLVKGDLQCRDLVDDAMHFHLQPQMFQKQKERKGKIIQEQFLHYGNPFRKHKFLPYQSRQQNAWFPPPMWSE